VLGPGRAEHDQGVSWFTYDASGLKVLGLVPTTFTITPFISPPPPGTLPSWGKRTSDFERLRMSMRLFARWQAEMERSAAIGIRPRPEPTVMGLDDRAADRQSHAHALRLGRIKRLEETLEAL